MKLVSSFARLQIRNRNFVLCFHKISSFGWIGIFHPRIRIRNLLNHKYDDVKFYVKAIWYSDTDTGTVHYTWDEMQRESRVHKFKWIMDSEFLDVHVRRTHVVFCSKYRFRAAIEWQYLSIGQKFPIILNETKYNAVRNNGESEGVAWGASVGPCVPSSLVL